MKKLLLLFAALCCTLMANAEDFIVDGIRYYVTGTDPNTVEVASNNYSGVIVIPATVTNDDTEYSVTGIGSGVFSNRSISSVSLPDGLKSIGNSAFSYCSIVGELIIPSTVTDIGPNAFANCTNLISVSLPNGLKRIKEHTFYGCTKLQYVSFPEELQSIGVFAFYNCNFAGALTIPSTVTEIGMSAFNSCSNLNSVSLPNGLKSISINTFSYCTNLSSVSLPKDLQNIDAAAFFNCSSLSSISLPEGLQSIGVQAFDGCNSLTSVAIPSTVTTIGGYAFNTTQLNEVLVYTDNLTEITEVWSKTIPTYVTGKSYDKYRSGIFKDYNVKLLSDADDIGYVIQNLTGISDEEANSIKALLKVRNTLGTPQDGPAIFVTDKDGKDIKLYSPKSVEFIKVNEK